MSKPFRLISLVALFALASIVAIGQDIEATIDIDFKTPAIVKVRGKYSKTSRIPNRRNLAFLRSANGAADLGSRISALRLSDSTGKPVSFGKLMDGEYLSDSDFDSWEYELNVSPSSNREAAAHVSWFADGKGILMLADLLPQFGSGRRTSARISFSEPARFDYESLIHTSEKAGNNGFEVSNIDDAVFYVGYGWEGGYSLTHPFSATLITSGSWSFSNEDALGMANEIVENYAKRLGPNASGPPFVAIAKFPGAVGFGQWQAETRGRNVTIISSDMPFRTQSLQRLHEQLRHELFHLWIPNGVNLTGNYDWFYEGFALYESLKLAVGLNRIRFEDFLDTLSRAHTIDSAQTQRTSLIQASKDRFAGANTQVYARGMLVAFLADLALLEQSKGKRSVEDVLTELFEKHRKPAEPVDANTAVLGLLRSNPKIVTIADRYITGADKLEWAAELGAFGIEDSDPGPLTTLRVKEKLSGRQMALLDKLGYNNWRKLSPTSK
jgi:hypothetical protein